MHPYKRSERMRLLLREEVADIIMRRVKDPRLGFVTVTDVALSEDLKIARVFVSALGDEEKKIALEVLNSAKGVVRSEIAKRIRSKVIPSVEFLLDESIDRGFRIDQLLKEIKDREKKEEPEE